MSVLRCTGKLVGFGELAERGRACIKPSREPASTQHGNATIAPKATSRNAQVASLPDVGVAVTHAPMPETGPVPSSWSGSQQMQVRRIPAGAAIGISAVPTHGEAFGQLVKRPRFFDRQFPAIERITLTPKDALVRFTRDKHTS